MSMSGGGPNIFMNIGGESMNAAAMGGGNATAIHAGNNMGGVGHGIGMIDNRPPPPPHTSLLHMAGKWSPLDLRFPVLFSVCDRTRWLPKTDRFFFLNVKLELI